MYSVILTMICVFSKVLLTSTISMSPSIIAVT